MKAISNSTVIILLAKIRKIELLNLYTIFLTEEVKNEIIGKKEIFGNEKTYLENFFKEKIKVENPKNLLSINLGSGENSSLSLCVEKKIFLFLTDDKEARKTAELLSIKPLGCIGVIIENLKEKVITKEEAKHFLNLLILNSYYLSTEAYAKAIDVIDNF